MQLRRQVRGVLFLDYVRMLRRRQSEHLDRYLRPEDLHYLGTRIDPDAWYPMEVFERLGLAILGEVVASESDSIRLWGRTQLGEVLRYMPGLTENVTPAQALKALGTYLSSMFDYPAVSIAGVTDGTASIHLAYGMSAKAEEAACLQALGFFESLIEECGGESLGGGFWAKSWDGAPVTVLQLMWALAEGPPPSEGLRVLVVDDEPLVLAALQRFLRRWADVVCASGTRDAREVLESAPIDAVLCDHELEEAQNGLAFLREVADRWPRIGRVLHTALPPPLISEELDAGTIHAVAEKPVSPSELRRTIERARQSAVEAAAPTRDG